MKVMPCWNHLALIIFVYADPVSGDRQENQRALLANLLFNQWGQHLDIIFVAKARACINLQTREAVVVGEADLQNAEVALQPLLLIDPRTDEIVVTLAR